MTKEQLAEAASNSIAITAAACRISGMMSTYRGSKLGSFIIDKIRAEVDVILAANRWTFKDQTRDSADGESQDSASK